MTYSHMLIGVVAIVGITAGSLCLSRWAQDPDQTDFRTKAYGLINAMVGTLCFTYFMIHVFRSISD
jgi:hypothetical protein